jgi:hypothetical protein
MKLNYQFCQCRFIVMACPTCISMVLTAAGSFIPSVDHQATPAIWSIPDYDI